MDQHFYPLMLILALFLGSLASCSESNNLGLDFFKEESFVATQEQSLELAITTILYDSLQTDNSPNLLVGFHQDAYLGDISATTYFQLVLDDTDTWTEDVLRYDSLTMVLDYDGYSFYDTLQLMTLSLHRLTEDLELDEETDALYNFSSFSFDPQPLAQVIFYPRPLRGKALEIRLPDQLGREFFEKISSEENELLDAGDFQDYFKGLALVAENTSSGAIIGFAKTSQMRLYYSDISVLPVQKKQRTYSVEGGLNFNQLLGNRSSTLLAALDAETAVPSTETDKLTFIQNGTGIATRVAFANLTDFQETQDEAIIITKAELTFYPLLATQAEQESLPETLEVAWIDQDDVNFYQDSEARLNTDLEFGRDTYYTLDVTDFVKYELQYDALNENALRLSFADPQYSLNRMVIGPGEGGRAMVLTLHLLDLKEN